MSINIYDYTDYRRYLREWFEDRKGRPSVRGFAKKVGCSPALISSIMAGTRDLAANLVEKFADALGLEGDERFYFGLMVEREQGGSMKVRREALERVLAMRRFRSARRIPDTMALIFSHWYYGAILELCRCKDFRDDPAWIAGVLMPPITPDQAAEALEVLLDAGFLARAADGRIEGADVAWATEHEVPRIPSAAVREHHQWVLARAGRALDEVPASERYYATLSFALPQAGFAELKQALTRVQEELLSRYTGMPEPERVYQVSMQLFPLTKP